MPVVEDKDGFQDKDGCPDIDNDEDELLTPMTNVKIILKIAMAGTTKMAVQMT